MFEQKKAIFVYCLSPVHMGAGSAIGVIDNPIQREKHTGYPTIAGSGLKGAIRHHFWALANGDSKAVDRINGLFGPEPDNSSDFAGAVSFMDAQLVAFPVRCAKKAFAYTTSPTLLARLQRILSVAGDDPQWNFAPIQEGSCKVASKGITTNNHVLLEAYDFTAEESEPLKRVAVWLSEHALPEGEAYKFFRDKLVEDLVLLSDEDLNYFVQNATIVEPHVRINDVTGTAEEGGLFYTENLPPESMLASLAMASVERKENGLDAKAVMDSLMAGFDAGEGGARVSGINGTVIQIGGDATTGRGQVAFKAL